MLRQRFVAGRTRAAANCPLQIGIGALIRRLRWVMMAVILFDIVITLLGQPASYWTDPSTAREENQWFHFIMSQGHWVSILTDVLYLTGSFLLVTYLPWRIALTLLFALILGHFVGGASWLCFYHRLGVQALVIYAAVLGGVMVFACFRPRRVPEGAGE